MEKLLPFAARAEVPPPRSERMAAEELPLVVTVRPLALVVPTATVSTSPTSMSSSPTFSPFSVISALEKSRVTDPFPAVKLLPGLAGGSPWGAFPEGAAPLGCPPEGISGGVPPLPVLPPSGFAGGWLLVLPLSVLPAGFSGGVPA